MKNKDVKMLFSSNKSKLMPMNIQFFAGSSDGSDGDGQGDEGGDGSEDDDSDDDDDGSEPPKTFTQDELNTIAAKEKKQGRKSAFKDLGFKSEKEAKDAIAQYEKWKQEKMTDDEKNQQMKNEKTEAEKRAQAAEEKLSVFTAGVRKDSVDDVLAIARTKVDDDTTLDDVLEEMKKDAKYKSFFTTSGSEGSGGTGNNFGRGSNGGNGGKEKNIGARLAEGVVKNNNTKSSYF